MYINVAFKFCLKRVAEFFTVKQVCCCIGMLFLGTTLHAQPIIARAINNLGCIRLDYKNTLDTNTLLDKWGVTRQEFLACNAQKVAESPIVKQGVWLPVGKQLLDEKCVDCIAVFYTVHPKENLFSIGKMFGSQAAVVLQQINRLKNTKLSVGQQLVVGYLPKALFTVPDTAAPPVGISMTLPTSPIPPQTEVATILKEQWPELTYTGNGFFAKEWQDALLTKQLVGAVHLFKSASGWDDGKFYLLTDKVAIGAVVKVSLLGTNKYIIAKVLGGLPNIQQNKGLIGRVNSAAFAMLGVDMAKNAQLSIEYK